MPSSGIEQSAMRLLEAFYDTAGGSLGIAMPIDGGEPGKQSVANRANLDPRSTECAVALRYLLNQNYIKPAAEDPSSYTLNAPGIDRVRLMRGLEEPEERRGMSEKMQRRLVTALSIAIAMGLSQPITRYISKEIPERRGIKDDLTEAFLQGLVRMAALFLASVMVRQLAARRK